MTLESKVREAIDSSEVVQNIINAVGAQQRNLARSLYYGIGIAVTEKVIGRLEDKTVPPRKDYLGFNLDDALAEFAKDFMIWHYVKGGYNLIKTALMVGSTPGTIYTKLGSLGITPQSVEAHPENYPVDHLDPIPDISPEELVRYASGEIRKYAPLIGNTKLRRRLIGSTEQVAGEIVALAQNLFMRQWNAGGRMNPQNYINLHYSRAKQQFRIDYSLAQFYRCGMNSKETCKRAGKSSAYFRKMVFDQGIDFDELKRAGSG